MIDNISAVIFDCDGVMFDSRQANINYYNRLLAHFDQAPMTEGKVDFVHMHTADESVRHIFNGTPFVDKAQAFKMKIDYNPFIRDMIIEPGLKDLLQALKTGYGLAVATNRSNTIGNVLRAHALNNIFDIVVSSLDVTNPKPHPESLFKILGFFGIRPEQAVYIGDSMVDYEVCRAAGVPLIAFRNSDLDTDMHAQSMAEAGAWLLGDTICMNEQIIISDK